MSTSSLPGLLHRPLLLVDLDRMLALGFSLPFSFVHGGALHFLAVHLILQALRVTCHIVRILTHLLKIRLQLLVLLLHVQSLHIQVLDGPLSLDIILPGNHSVLLHLLLVCRDLLLVHEILRLTVFMGLLQTPLVVRLLTVDLS